MTTDTSKWPKPLASIVATSSNWAGTGIRSVEMAEATRIDCCSQHLGDYLVETEVEMAEATRIDCCAARAESERLERLVEMAEATRIDCCRPSAHNYESIPMSKWPKPLASIVAMLQQQVMFGRSWSKWPKPLASIVACSATYSACKAMGCRNGRSHSHRLLLAFSARIIHEELLSKWPKPLASIVAVFK